ncbi:MAG: DUF4386 domain-containing protein [Bacteroidia bacterium]
MKVKIDTIQIDKARIIGAFFLLVFLAYGFGRNLFDSESDAEKYMGALLIMANSIMVFFIGFWFRKTLQQYNALVGNIYLFARTFEAIILACLVLKLFSLSLISDNIGYFLGMLVLGLGSIPMCLTLYKHQIAPAWLAIWGIIGYSIFSFGFLMELFGNEWSMYLLGLAGLWEITFGIWLMMKGGQSKK